jgi:toxin YoeB
VVEDRTEFVVTRKAGDVVLVARDEYDSLIETLHLLSSPANAAARQTAQRQVEGGADRPPRTAPFVTEDDLEWVPIAWEQYEWWDRNDTKVRDRINALIESALTTPSGGIGKPEPLRGSLSGCWSRRITLEHRLVYEVEVRDGRLIVHQCRFRY